MKKKLICKATVKQKMDKKNTFIGNKLPNSKADNGKSYPQVKTNTASVPKQI